MKHLDEDVMLAAKISIAASMDGVLSRWVWMTTNTSRRSSLILKHELTSFLNLKYFSSKLTFSSIRLSTAANWTVMHLLKWMISSLYSQRCSTRVQNLDSSPTRIPFFGTWTWTSDLWTWTWTWHLRTETWTWHIRTWTWFSISLMENPDSQSEILNHLFWKSIKADPIGSSLFSKLLLHWIYLTVYQCIKS